MRKDDDCFFEKLFVLFLVLEPINQALRLAVGFEAQFIFSAIYLILMIINFRKVKNLKVFLLFVLFFVVSLCYSMFGYVDHLYNFFGLMYLIMVTSLPWLLIGLNTFDISRLFKMISDKLLCILASNIILVFVCLAVKGSLVGNMEISYSILPLTVFSLYQFLNQKNFLSLFVFLVSLFIIIGFGSRGPLLCVIFFLFVYLMLNIKKHKLMFGFFIILSMFAFFNFKSILYGSIDLLASHGIESRTLYKMKNGDIADDTGRSKIHGVVYDLIDKNWLAGVGLGVERITINNEIYGMSKDMSSCYPHNLFLELIVQYGWFVGGFICVWVVFLLLRAIVAAKGKERDMLLIIVSIEFVRLMISSSYVVSVLLFYLVGLCIRIIKEKRTRNEKSLNSGSI